MSHYAEFITIVRSLYTLIEAGHDEASRCLLSNLNVKDKIKLVEQEFLETKEHLEKLVSQNKEMYTSIQELEKELKTLKNTNKAVKDTDQALKEVQKDPPVVKEKLKESK